MSATPLDRALLPALPALRRRLLKSLGLGALALSSAVPALAEPQTASAATSAASAPPSWGPPAPGDAGVWLDTYATLSRLADAGSVSASRLALEMHRVGPTVYGTEFPASTRQLQCWQWVVQCGRCDPCVVYG
jgi:hypothetical protein